MLVSLDEKISVVSFYDSRTEASIPKNIYWRGREYVIEKIGLHHHFWKGRILIHVFSVTSGDSYLRLRFETDSLRWFLDSFE
jgi:hypothetical protein